MSKFDRLWAYIAQTGQTSRKLSFEEIARVGGVPIDHSFLNAKKELAAYGYRVKKISQKEEWVLFEKTGVEEQGGLKPSVLHTARLTLHPYEERDRERMIQLLTDSRIKETFMIPDYASEAEEAQAFERLLRASHSPEHYERGIYREERLIGFVNDVAIQGGVMEIGYVIHPDEQNRGFATEALSAVLPDLKARGCHRVEAGAFADNFASRRVLEKSGMQLLDRTEELLYHGEMRPCVYYAIGL